MTYTYVSWVVLIVRRGEGLQVDFPYPKKGLIDLVYGATNWVKDVLWAWLLRSFS